MRIKTLLGFGVTTVASALTLQCGPAWADGPETAYAAEDEAPAGSLSADEYQVNADGMKEDPKAKMSDVARAYRNGYINRGKEDQAGYNAMIESHNHGQRKPTNTPTNTQVARVDVPPLPAGLPEDDNSKYTTIPPQPRQYAQRQVSQPRQVPQPPPQLQQQPQYRQAYQYQEPQYAPAMPMQYQQAPEYAQMQMQPQPVYADSQPVYVRQEYAPPPPVQYVQVYAQQQYDEMPVVETVMQPAAPPVAYQVYRPPVYWSTTPRMYAYRAPVVSYRMWR
jgi:hypothetical protein